MKLTKTVKYNFHLTEETLEKDMDSFINEARRGRYSWDYKYNGEGLKIIRQYFKILKEKFENQEYQECKLCYEKLIIFLLDASCGEDKADFGYEDLLAKISSDFDEYINKYFICLVKTCNSEELAERVSKYTSHLNSYGFDSDKKVLIENLDELAMHNLEQRMLIKTEGMTKIDQNKQDMLYFLIWLAEAKKDKQKYNSLCERFKGVLNDKEITELKNEYGESEILKEKFNKAMEIAKRFR
jgi:hypothetical protein